MPGRHLLVALALFAAICQCQAFLLSGGRGTRFGKSASELASESASECGPAKGKEPGSPRSNATGQAICDELQRLPNYDQMPDLPAKRCNVNTGENCRAVLQLGGSIGDPAAGFSSTFGTYTMNQLVLAEILGMIPYADYTGEHAGSYWERVKKGDTRSNNAWEYYFNPVSAYSPGDGRFAGLPVCKVTWEVNMQLHSRQGWSVRSWTYGCAKRRSYEQVMASSRPLGSRIVAQYYKAKPEVQLAVNGSLGEGRHWGKQKVLGMHIRGTDKSNGRQIVGPEAYYPHAAAFLKKYPGSLIYLATDDDVFRAEVLAWPSKVTSRVVAHPLATNPRDNEHCQEEGAPPPPRAPRNPQHPYDCANSTSTHPFGGKDQRFEGFMALVDILSLAKCDWLLHSISGLSEFAVYFNPALQRHSTNLERNETPSYNL